MSQVFVLTATLLLVGIALQGCGTKSNDDGGPTGGDDRKACGKEDLACLCKADCRSSCNNYNISSVDAAKQCAGCMASKCAQDAKDLCTQHDPTTCLNCITAGGFCWETTQFPCLAQCLEWWKPAQCVQCWLVNYTGNCLNEYKKCYDPDRTAKPIALVNEVTSLPAAKVEPVTAMPLKFVQACGKDDLACICKADCQNSCNNYNITTLEEAKHCAGCMASKCAQDAKALCTQQDPKTCLNCITAGGFCWETTWPHCVAQCLKVWEPAQCAHCWLVNYTGNCLNEYKKCYDPNMTAESVQVVI
jgi:hypothetical protein